MSWCHEWALSSVRMSWCDGWMLSSVDRERYIKYCDILNAGCNEFVGRCWRSFRKRSILVEIADEIGLRPEEWKYVYRRVRMPTVMVDMGRRSFGTEKVKTFFYV